MARTSQPNSVGSQFFIVLDDAARRSLGDPRNTYQIIGEVTSGMEAVDAIAAMRRAAAARPTRRSQPVAMTDVVRRQRLTPSTARSRP